VGALVALVGVLVLAVPMRAHVRGVEFRGRPAADVAAPFSLTVALDPTSGTVSVPSDLRPQRDLSFRSPIDVYLTIRAGKGGPIGVSVTDRNGPVVANASVPPRKSEQVAFSVHDQIVTVRIWSDTGQLRSVSLGGESADRNVWVWSAEDRSRQVGYLVFAVVMVGVGGAITVSAFLRPPAPTVGWVLVAFALLVALFTPLYPLLLTSVGTALALIYSYAWGTRHRGGVPAGVSDMAVVLAIPALLGIGFATYLVQMGSTSRDYFQSSNYFLELAVLFAVGLLLAPVAWIIGADHGSKSDVTRTVGRSLDDPRELGGRRGPDHRTGRTEPAPAGPTPRRLVRVHLYYTFGCVVPFVLSVALPVAMVASRSDGDLSTGIAMFVVFWILGAVAGLSAPGILGLEDPAPRPSVLRAWRIAVRTLAVLTGLAAVAGALVVSYVGSL
jgi:hypothetical protein